MAKPTALCGSALVWTNPEKWEGVFFLLLLFCWVVFVCGHVFFVFLGGWGGGTGRNRQSAPNNTHTHAPLHTQNFQKDAGNCREEGPGVTWLLTWTATYHTPKQTHADQASPSPSSPTPGGQWNRQAREIRHPCLYPTTFQFHPSNVPFPWMPAPSRQPVCVHTHMLSDQSVAVTHTEVKSIKGPESHSI